MVLSQLRVGASGQVSRVDAPGAQALRWVELGLRPGARLEVRSRTAGGGRLVSIGTVRIALDQWAADQITVDPT